MLVEMGKIFNLLAVEEKEIIVGVKGGLGLG